MKVSLFPLIIRHLRKCRVIHAELTICPEIHLPTTTMSACYKAALVLNNMAIGLMQRSSFHLAYDTFKDAVLLIKASQQQQESVHQDDVLVHQKLGEANRRIASPTASPFTSVPTSITVVSHNDGDFSGSISKVSEQLIRFDSSDSDLLEQQEDNLVAAIILYNFGCCALLRDHQYIGIKYLTFALQIMQGLYDDSQEQPFDLKRIVYISTIVLQTLIPAQFSQGLKEEARSSCKTLNELAEMASELNQCCLFSRDFELCASVA
jgi:hypothetical protein